MAILTRRRFLFAVAGAGAAAAVPVGLGWGRRARNEAHGVRAFHETGFALGTSVTLVALHADEGRARTALTAAFAELRAIEEVMSIYRLESALCRLNRDGFLERPHRYLLDILRQAQALAEQSGGAFDVTVQPLWELYARGGSPGAVALAGTLARVGYRDLRLAPGRIDFSKPGMAVVLNGIAQGYAADRVLTVLREHGVTRALVNTGEIAPLGKNQEGQPWRVGIQHPRQPEAYIALADLDGRSLSTSGDYATTFTADRRDSHIFDPATGRSPTELASVSVVAPTATLADGLSTALLVLGAKRGAQLLATIPNTDAFFVDKAGTVLATARFPRVHA